MSFDVLLEKARAAVRPRALGRSSEAGAVAAAVETAGGSVYTGVNIDTPCSMGFCAEHAAIAAMVTAGESRIVRLVAVHHSGRIVPPCGRCREFVCQIDEGNIGCQVMLEGGRVVAMEDLLPDRWLG
mgnify:CR=1 FL=1